MNRGHFGKDAAVPKEYVGPYNKFYINTLKDVGQKIKFPLPPHRKPIFDFLFLTKGRTKRGKALNLYEFQENTFFFLPAYQITSHEYVSEDIDGYYCHFNMDIFADWVAPNLLLRKFPFLQFTGNPVVKVNKRSKPFILPIMERLTRILREKNEIIRHDLIASHLLTLFAEINHFSDNLEVVRKESAYLITERYKDALAKMIYDYQQVSEYASHLSISPNHLNKCVKQTMGISAQELLNRMVLLEAKVLLKQTDFSISHIAFQLSRKNHSDFSRFFKSKTGFTPKKYRLG